MKTVFMFAFMTSIFSLNVKPPAHFLTVDETGKPLSGVKVKMSWTVDRGKGNLGCERKELVSDADGRFHIGGAVHEWIDLESVTKDGYIFSKYLNQHPPSGRYVEQFTKERPFEIVLRKLNAEQSFVLGQGGETAYEIKTVRKGEKAVPYPLWVVGEVDGKRHMAADCFALPEFDEVKKAWKCTFWTTNANGGVLATTNRVFMAPETGYAKRVEVPMSVCNHPAFTLYVKTYDPQLYAMFFIYGFGANARDKRSQNKMDPAEFPGPDKKYVSLEVESCCYNPFGERVLEVDTDIYVAIWSEHDKEFLPMLEQHRYPPRPNRKARIENYRRRMELLEEMADLYRKEGEARSRLEDIKKRLSDGSAGKDDSIGKLDAEVNQYWKRLNECKAERERLEAEAPKLNLPD